MFRYMKQGARGRLLGNTHSLKDFHQAIEVVDTAMADAPRCGYRL